MKPFGCGAVLVLFLSACAGTPAVTKDNVAGFYQDWPTPNPQGKGLYLHPDGTYEHTSGGLGVGRWMLFSERGEWYVHLEFKTCRPTGCNYALQPDLDINSFRVSSKAGRFYLPVDEGDFQWGWLKSE